MSILVLNYQEERPLVLALVQGNAQIRKKKLRALDQKSSDRAQIKLVRSEKP